ncbi:FAD-dependent oxidoreductase [Sphingomonas sp. YR710]|uniref:FAD-dependent oxidoreductase n=1 Tax=Sphingomonas sp. YR710 TaxID=1882773 RepID=UPI000B869689|nr:FAD-dependent oxidoreductase [Sphingomonas sp. YR710]
MTVPGLSTITIARARITMRLWLAGWRTLRAAIAPPADLAIRITIGQAFLLSGLVKAMHWQDALYLARYEYPLSWISPAHAAVLGLAIELVCPVLLMLGLFTRAAALPMAALAIVIQVDYQVLDTNLFQAAILAGYVMFGAGPIAIDALLAPGLRDSALPLIPRIARAAQALTLHVGPAFQLAIRIWFGWALLGLPGSPAILPTGGADALPAMVAQVGAIALIAGAALPATAILLATATSGMAMMMGPSAANLWMIVLLVQLAMLGAGRLSIDRLLAVRMAACARPALAGGGDWPHIVIIGAGFGGMACAARLRHLPVRLTIVDRHNYHLFQPLLYQVATAGLSPADIASPIRSQFRDDANVRVVMGEVSGIDADRKHVLIGDWALSYDRLVIATGASHSYFGRDDWAAFAPGLKRIEDATAMRARLLAAFERAETATDVMERNALLTFVIVGAGPTGVELAGALAELARFGLQEEFRDIDPASARIILVQSGARILPAFPEGLSARAQASLEKLGVTIWTNSRVQAIDAQGVTIDGELVRAGTVLWAAGVVASPAARWLDVAADPAGRVPVDMHLRVEGHPDIFAIGDTAASSGWAGRPVPGLAPAAKQGGEHVARFIRADLEARPLPAPFAYRHQGSLATIGRKAAIADFGRLRLWGAPAWWLWGAIHVLFLSGLRNRASVMLSWMWAYLTFRSGTRLITGAPQRT